MDTARKRQLVVETFALVRPRSDEVAALFYERLFNLAPELRALFPNDMRAQGRKLMDTIGMAAVGLSNLDDLAALVRALGRRHTRYGARSEHYPLVGSALLWALARALGDAFTPEVEAAWTDVYRFLSEEMLGGARDAHSFSEDDQPDLG